MSLRRSMRRLADRISPATTGTHRFKLATVDHVTAGAARDGHTAAFVRYGADVIPAPYLASYTPVAGHLVEVLLVDSSPLILGQVIGLPDF